MTQAEVFYLQQAANCGVAAAASTLDNQRDKYLNAQAAWEGLAHTAAKVRTDKAQRDAERSATLHEPPVAQQG